MIITEIQYLQAVAECRNTRWNGCESIAVGNQGTQTGEIAEGERESVECVFSQIQLLQVSESTDFQREGYNLIIGDIQRLQIGKSSEGRRKCGK